MLSKVLGCGALVVALAGPATAQVAILQIHVIEGEGAVHAPGGRVSRPLTVEITDETGNPVEGASVSFHLPDEGPTGVFLNGLRTEVSTTNAQGRAALHGMVLNRVAGRFQIRVVASREQARAGVIAFQYIAETRTGASAASSAGARTAASRGRARWIVIAAVVVGGAVAGIAGAGHSGTSAAPPAASPPATVSIGAPSTTLGKP